MLCLRNHLLDDSLLNIELHARESKEPLGALQQSFQRLRSGELIGALESTNPSSLSSFITSFVVKFNINPITVEEVSIPVSHASA